MFNIGSAELVVLLFILVVSAAGVWLVVRATRTSRQANRALIEMNEREKRSEQGGAAFGLSGDDRESNPRHGPASRG